MKFATQSQREIPPELAADCALSLAFRTDLEWRHVPGSHMGWGDENFQVQTAVVELWPAATERQTGGCLNYSFVGDNGEQIWARLILADVDLYREIAASLGRPILSDEKRAAMVQDIRI